MWLFSKDVCPSPLHCNDRRNLILSIRTYFNSESTPSFNPNPHPNVYWRGIGGYVTVNYVLHVIVTWYHPDSTVANYWPLWLVGTRFASRYRLQPRYFKCPIDIYKAIVPSFRSLTTNRLIKLIVSSERWGVYPGQHAWTLSEYKHENKYKQKHWPSIMGRSLFSLSVWIMFVFSGSLICYGVCFLINPFKVTICLTIEQLASD